jgi:hypothetical protein
MACYRIYRLDPAGRITGAYPIACRSDAVALNVARQVWQWAAGVEVWEGIRRVARLAPDQLLTGFARLTPSPVSEVNPAA